MPSVVLQQGGAEGETAHGGVELWIWARRAKDDAVEDGSCDKSAVEEHSVSIRFWWVWGGHSVGGGRICRMSSLEKRGSSKGGSLEVKEGIRDKSRVRKI